MSTYTDGRVRDSVMANRHRFLWAVHELAPEVLAELERDVLPLFRALYREEPSGAVGESCTFVWDDSGMSSVRLWITWPSWKEANRRGEIWTGPSWTSDISGVKLDSAGVQFRNAMERWASAHHLRCEAIKEDAFSTLCFWLVSPRVNRVWLPRGYSPTMDEITNVPKLHVDDAWDFQPWSIVEERLQKKILEYKSEVTKYCERIGFDLDRMRQDRCHHEWLALYQCRGMAPAKIRDWEQKNHKRTVDPSAVSHAVESLAEKIGLERRRGRRGPARPR
jgi:hypothetical protein